MANNVDNKCTGVNNVQMMNTKAFRSQDPDTFFQNEYVPALCIQNQCSNLKDNYCANNDIKYICRDLCIYKIFSQNQGYNCHIMSVLDLLGVHYYNIK